MIKTDKDSNVSDTRLLDFLAGLMMGAGLNGFFMTIIIDNLTPTSVGNMPYYWFAMFLLGAAIPLITKFFAIGDKGR